MQIKRFEAKTMTQALQMVKAEFGPEAVILSARSLRGGRGLFGAARAAGVEVTAAKDSGWGAPLPSGSAAAAPPAAAGGRPAANGGRTGVLRTLNHTLRNWAGRARDGAAAADPGLPEPGLDTGLAGKLLAGGLRREIAAELAAGLAAAGTPAERAALLGALERLGVSSSEPGSGASGGRLRAAVIVGPTGVGKTTAAVKLALRHSRGGLKTALMTVDDRRIGAVAQLQTYAEITGLPFAAAPGAAGARSALERLAAFDRVIVDTPGVSPGDPALRAELDSMLAELAGAEVILLLNAALPEKDLEAAIGAWRHAGITHLGFARLDETGACGSLINVLAASGLPLAFLSTGPAVPEDFAPGGLAALADRLLSGVARGSDATGAPAGAFGRPGAAPRWVANRNSDLYHRPDCRWVKRISARHLVGFASAAQAEAESYRPCRDCQPAAQGEAETAAASAENRRISAWR
jgi:flagellar biosynthesis protein FlhF